MIFRSSPGRVLFLILLLRVAAVAQAPETVVATIDGREITLRQVDETVSAAVGPLQQQLFAIRRVALDNLILARLLENEARAQGVSVDELRQRLTRGEIAVTRAQVEDAYVQNASFFASMSPDEARERLRLDLETQARMRNYRAGLEALRKKWTVVVNFVGPPVALELSRLYQVGGVIGLTEPPMAEVIPTALSDDRFLRGDSQERRALCPSEKGQWSGPLVLHCRSPRVRSSFAHCWRATSQARTWQTR